MDQDKQLGAVCSVNAVLCKEKYGFIVEYRNEIKKALADTQNLPAVYESGLLAQQVDAEDLVLNVELARQFKTKYNISDADAANLTMAVYAIGAGKAIKGKGTTASKYPVPEPTKANNGLIYKSNSKHTLGGEGNRPNAGIEPKNSLELFENSIPITGNSNKRFTIDSKGNTHQFTYEGTGSNTYHWAGGTGDARNPLKLDNKTKAILRKNGWKSEALK